MLKSKNVKTIHLPPSKKKSKHVFSGDAAIAFYETHELNLSIEKKNGHAQMEKLIILIMLMLKMYLSHLKLYG